MAALRPKHEIRDEPGLAAAPGAGGVGGLGVPRRQQFELDDPRLQAAAFFFVSGSCVMLNGTAVNGSAANPEHILAGYGLFTIGAALAFLTLSGHGRLGRVAARLEEALRGFF